MGAINLDKIKKFENEKSGFLNRSGGSGGLFCSTF